MPDEPKRPVPLPTPTSVPFWEGLQAGVLRLQWCVECRRWVYYPRSHCPGCLGDELSWHEVPARGRVYAVTTLSQGPTAPLRGDSEMLAIVELEAGPRLPTRLVVDGSASVAVGTAVVGVFDRRDDGSVLLLFAPAPMDPR